MLDDFLSLAGELQVILTSNQSGSRGVFQYMVISEHPSIGGVLCSIVYQPMLSFNIMIPFSSKLALLVSLKIILQVKGMTKPGKKDVETVEKIGKLGGDLESMVDDPAVDNVFKALAEVDPEVKETLDCDKCGKTYGTKGSLRTHKYNHIKKEMVEESKDIKEFVDNEVTIQK